MDTQLANLTLREAYRLQGNESRPYDIPWLVWLLENPDSPLPFPGQIHLREHDYLHLIFGLDRSNENEAFLVGFSMGLDLNTKPIHLILLKFISQYLYPKFYKFSKMDITSFERGFLIGRMPKFKPLSALNFECYLDLKLSEIRIMFGLERPEQMSLSRQFSQVVAMSKSRSIPVATAHLRPP